MHYGIKVSKSGFDVTDRSKPRKISSKTRPDYIIYALSLPYLNGAYNQIQRYIYAISILEKSKTNGVIICLHEISTLFEDLDTVARYIDETGITHDLHTLIRVVRNHIRHDIRENFDVEDHKFKNQRNSILKIDPTLQTHIGFHKDSIKIGEIIISIEEIKNYLDWARKIIEQEIKKAKEMGYIKSF